MGGVSVPGCGGFIRRSAMDRQCIRWAEPPVAPGERPARISAQMAAKLGVDPHTMHIALEAAVREHLQELGEMRPRVD